MHYIKDEQSTFTHYFKPVKYALNLTPMEHIDSQRRSDKWTIVKDKCRTMQIQNEFIETLNEEDPTFGLNITIRSLEYLSRRTARARGGEIDFNTLGKMRQSD